MFQSQLLSFLRNLKSYNGKIKKQKNFFYKDLEDVRVYATGGYYVLNAKRVDFGVRVRVFLIDLAACSVVVGGRDRINLDDVVRAYRTYLKLLKTDLPALVGKLGV